MKRRQHLKLSLDELRSLDVQGRRTGVLQSDKYFRGGRSRLLLCRSGWVAACDHRGGDVRGLG